tara:strand:+ start:822 stop:1124 length:303 start_codon:yes stop_codon:yes gene_type:complete
MKETIIEYNLKTKVVDKSRRRLNKDIKYYNNYKTQLNQFIIYNCSYNKPSKLQDRIRLDTRELLGVLKEISRIEKIIYALNSFKLNDKSMAFYIYNMNIK